MTDLYGSDVHEEGYDGFFMTSYYPHFEVFITLEDGTEIIMKSDSNYHCWIPWNVTYKEKTYVQYNGAIPSALMRILAVLDKKWAGNPKLIQYGCYPAPAPGRYAEKGISSDFPARIPVTTPEEQAGIPHLLWATDVERFMIVSPLFVQGNLVVLAHDTVMVFAPETGRLIWKTVCGEIACEPVYQNGILFISTTESVTALDFETGKIRWKTPIEKESRISWIYTHELVLYNDTLLLGAKGPRVYCINIHTGAILWKYCEEGPNYAYLHIVGDRLIVNGDGLRSFDAKTGTRIWEFSEDLYDVRHVDVYEDKILVRTYRSTEGFCWNLLQTESGELLWKRNEDDVEYPIYHNGMLYFCSTESSRIVCMDTESMKEVWSYPNKNTVGGIEIFGETVAFVEYTKKDYGKEINRLVLLDNKGNEVLQLKFREREMEWSNFILNLHFYDDVLFLIPHGAVQALNMNTGNRLWTTEVRGEYIASFTIHNDTVYVTSDDSRLYCMDVKRGQVLWYYELEKEMRYFDIANVLDPRFEGNFIAVATRDGGIFLFVHCRLSGPYVSSGISPRIE